MLQERDGNEVNANTIPRLDGGVTAPTELHDERVTLRAFCIFDMCWDWAKP